VECSASSHSLETVFLVRNITKEAFETDKLDAFVWLFSTHVSDNNLQQLTFTSHVDVEDSHAGLIVSVNSLFAEAAHAEAAAVQFRSHSTPFKRAALEPPLGLQIVHYGRALTPSPRTWSTPEEVLYRDQPRAVQIDGMNVSIHKVTDADSPSKGVAFLEISFMPDPEFVLDDATDLVSAVRVGSGAARTEVAMQEVCSSFFSNTGLLDQFKDILNQACAPVVEMCEIPRNVNQIVTLHIPMLESLYTPTDAALYVEFDVNMKDAATNIVYSSPIGASISLDDSDTVNWCLPEEPLASFQQEAADEPEVQGGPGIFVEDSDGTTEDEEPSTTPEEPSSEEPSPEEPSATGTVEVAVAAGQSTVTYQVVVGLDEEKACMTGDELSQLLEEEIYDLMENATQSLVDVVVVNLVVDAGDVECTPQRRRPRVNLTPVSPSVAFTGMPGPAPHGSRSLNNLISGSQVNRDLREHVPKGGKGRRLLAVDPSVSFATVLIYEEEAGEQSAVMEAEAALRKEEVLKNSMPNLKSIAQIQPVVSDGAIVLAAPDTYTPSSLTGADEETLVPVAGDASGEESSGEEAGGSGPLVMVGGGIAALCVAGASGTVVVRRRRQAGSARGREALDRAGPAEGGVWIQDLQTQVTSELVQHTDRTSGARSGDLEGGAENLERLEHLHAAMGAAEMEERLTGGMGSEYVSAVVCCDDGKEREGVRRVGPEGASGHVVPSQLENDSRCEGPAGSASGMSAHVSAVLFIDDGSLAGSLRRDATLTVL